MPYRRLPNTDNARLRALNNAQRMGENIPPFNLAYNQCTLTKINALLPRYLNCLSEHRQAYSLQLEKSKKQNAALKKARLYISHFMQVINMSIQRGDLSPEIRTYFGMKESNKKLPDLSTEEDLHLWSQKLIQGEQKRQLMGMNPITNPTIAVVKVYYEKFNEASQQLNVIRKRVEKLQINLSSVRSEADSLIQQLWNEIENRYKDLPDDMKREKSSEYGVVYVFRKTEVKRSDLMELSHFAAG